MKVALRSRSKQKAKRPRAVWPVTAVLWQGVCSILRRRWLRRTLIGGGSAVAIFCLLFAVLWWRLGSGPIEFDVASPWLTTAIEDNFGANYKVEVGGTQIERDGNGRIRLRLRDIVVRDGEGAIAASAPKAEVGFSSRTLLTGRVRAERLALVGAEMSVRIEQSGNVTVFAGSDKRPIATASVPVPGMSVGSPRGPDAHNGSAEQPSQKSTFENFTAFLAWLDSLGATGLDGHDLAELGLKNGNLTVDDQRNGKRWSFENIDLSLMRARNGNIVFKVESGSEEDAWSMTVNVGRVRSASRVFTLEARRVMAKDLLLALRLGDDPIMARVPLSASLRAEIGTDGTTRFFEGRIIAEGGPLTESDDPSAPSIDRAEFSPKWDPARRLLVMPFQVLAGSNRFNMVSYVEPPRTPGAPWNFAIVGGSVILGGDKGSQALVFTQTKIRALVDPNTRVLTLLQGDIANADIGVGVNGDVDFSTSDPKLNIGLSSTRMPLEAMKRMWPTFINAPVRNWVIEHTGGGDIEKVAIATNAHLSAFKKGGPPVPDNGLSIEVFARNAVLRPLDTLPPIEDAEVSLNVDGRKATVTLSKGSAVLPSGRKLTLTNSVFEVPDSEITEPPTRTELRVEGPVPVVAELLESDRLKEFSAMPFELSSARGNVFAQASLAFPLKRDLPPGSSTYSVRADIANFSVDKMIMGQKVEAQSLRITADNQTYQIKGDTKIAGVPAYLEYTKSKSDEDAKVRIRTMLDDSARTKFGVDPGNAVNGSVSLTIEGTVGSPDKDSRFTVEADLASARIDNLLPGWSKLPGKAGRAKLSLITRGQSVRIEDLTVDGAGTRINKGSIEFDGSGDVVSANFPVFSLSDGDKVSLKADRGQDGTLRVIMRGDVYDGRGFIKSAVSGSRPDPKGKPPIDFDLDLKLGAVIGFNGETLRNVDLKASRRSGQIRAFSLNAKLGRDSQIIGDIRDIRRKQGGNSLYFETRDAGALFKFTDTYAKMVGGAMQVAMDPSTNNAAPQEGIISVRDFAIRGEAALDRVVSGPQQGSRFGVKFDSAQAEFSRMPGQIKIRDGVVQGNIGATIDGQIDYANDEVRLRGSLVPLSPLNNALGLFPIVGPIFGGGDKGLFGVTYEVVGRPNAPRLNVNPLSALAPGVFQRIFDFRDAPADRSFEPRRRD